MNLVAENKAQFVADATALYEELTAWRAAHPQASFDEMAEQGTVKGQALMGELTSACGSTSSPPDLSLSLPKGTATSLSIGPPDAQGWSGRSARLSSRG